jgi:hypothetical protein
VHKGWARPKGLSKPPEAGHHEVYVPQFFSIIFIPQNGRKIWPKNDALNEAQNRENRLFLFFCLLVFGAVLAN